MRYIVKHPIDIHPEDCILITDRPTDCDQETYFKLLGVVAAFNMGVHDENDETWASNFRNQWSTKEEASITRQFFWGFHIVDTEPKKTR